MAIKQMIGAVMKELGFVTKDQLEAALSIQSRIAEEKLLPETRERSSLVSEARYSSQSSMIPLLGNLLLDLGHISEDQLLEALKTQTSLLEKYRGLESDALFSVLDLGALVNSSLNLAEVLSYIMKSANRVTGSMASTLMLVEDDTGDLVFSVPTGPTAEKLMDIRIEKGKGIAGWVALHEEPVVVKNAQKDPRFFGEIDHVTGFETRSLAAVPLKAKNKLIGVLEVINKEDNTPFNDQDVILLTIFASQAAMAIENARLYGELKDHVHELHLMENRLAEVEKHRVLGQLSAGVAHDFNNILSAVIGYSELALYSQDDPGRVKHNIHQVLNSAGRAKKLVEQILAFTRKTVKEKTPIRCEKIVRESLVLLKSVIPSNVTLNQRIDPEAGTVLGDATQIQQVVMNLCTNAYHAIGEGPGEISATLERFERDADNQPDYPNIIPGVYAKITIADTGCGMDQCTVDQIFEPYFTTKDKAVGTGLGLAVVDGIVTSHNGFIDVRSTENEGTLVEVFLPQIEAIPDEEIVVPHRVPEGNERILFIDDEDALAELGKGLLSHLGYRVTAMNDPLKALRTFRNDPSAVDLVITDMSMPGMNGMELTAALMEIRPDIPIILCTGFSEHVTETSAKEHGIKAFILKPLNLYRLAATIREVLEPN